MKISKVFIIAEAGVNHNGSLKLAKKIIDAAKSSGADAVKFQTFKAEDVVSKSAPLAKYQLKNAKYFRSQLEMLRKLELSIEDHKKIIDYCKDRKITFLSSPFDLKSIVLLAKLGLKTFKIPSGEINNLPYLRKIGALKKRVVLSTGMAEIKEIGYALRTLIKAGTSKDNIIVLHCHTEYPTLYKDVNLNAMIAIKKIFNIDVGYSDHTLGIEVPIAAVSLGASVIEKHFTLNKNMAGPDHKASINPHEFETMVKMIRNIEIALGNRQKKVSLSEEKNRLLIRKSIVAARNIRKGETFTLENITTKRPGNGLSPLKWDNVLGKLSKKCFMKDQLIEL